ncbi:ArdC family protein [Thiomicrospira sp.]|uniref:ArdC family protein n=1 Tax=Thiomicrospira sp. TaxID=935 RepID=UPI002F936CDC
MNNQSIFERVTNDIVEHLLRGVTAKWKCPWDRMTSVAINAKTGKRLVGISQILCSMSMIQNEYQANKWLTFKQAKNLGGEIIKGSKSTLVFWLRPFVKVEIDGKEKLISPEGEELHNAIEEGNVIWSYQYAPYFNVEQIDGLDDEFYEPVQQASQHGLGDGFTPIAEAEAFIDLLQTSNDPLKLTHQGNQAYYAPATDDVVMPDKAKFHDELSYYGTLFHEVGHWTGCQARLNRKGIVDKTIRFGDSAYAYEELVAELTASFKAAEMGLEREIREDHVQYIASWIQALRDDHKLIFKASQEAMKAVRLMNQLADHQIKLFESV